MKLERLTIPLPKGFDPTSARHVDALLAKVSEKMGPGWEVESVSTEKSTATLTRQSAVMEVATRGGEDTEPEAYEITLPYGTKPTDGDKVAARQADAHPGYHLVEFRPHLGRAVLAKLTEPELRCRDAVANALGVKPWDVGVAARRDGGFAVQLPNSYAPSKHDVKLQEVAEHIVGRFGWYVDVDPKTLVAQIVPSEPPTFPETAPLPLKKLGRDSNTTPFGLKLPGPGEKAKEPVEINWKASSWALVSGLPGGGKTVVINNVIADHLAAGGLLVIVDDPSKAIDYHWCRDYVIDGGWGCDGLREAVTSLTIMYEEGKRRAQWMADHGYVNWQDIPAKDRFKPILAVVDEASALLVTERLPAGVDKKLPEVQEIIEENRLRFKLQSRIRKIMAEQRFVGARMLISTQVTNAATGLPPSMKALIGQKVLMGTNPSKTQRQQAFNVETGVPQVPPNLVGGGGAARGVGATELDSQTPCVFKGYFAPTSDLAAEMDRRGAPRTSRPAPTGAEMDLHCPVGDDMDDDDGGDGAGFTLGEERLPSGRPVSSLDPKFGPGPAVYGEDGKRLAGAAAAAHASRVAGVEAAGRPMCPSCDKPILPDNSCGCSW